MGGWNHLPSIDKKVGRASGRREGGGVLYEYDYCTSVHHHVVHAKLLWRDNSAFGGAQWVQPRAELPSLL